MGASRTEILAWLSTLAGVLVTDTLDSEDITNRAAAAPALPSDGVAVEVLSIMRIIAETVSTPADFDAIVLPVFNDSEASAVAAILTAYGLSIAAPRVAWLSRQQARAARGRIAQHGEVALAFVSGLGAVAVDLYRYLSRIIEVAVLVVSEQAANAVPIIRAETGLSMPSTVLAYQLYGDASRAASLVEIARSTTPMLMPIPFDALES